MSRTLYVNCLLHLSTCITGTVVTSFDFFLFFLFLAHYIPNEVKGSIWHQCKKCEYY